MGSAACGCHRVARTAPAASVGVRRSAPTAAADARGAAGWPRGETCHVAHGALLRPRLRHRVRTHGWSSGGACGVEGGRGAPSGAAAVDPAASSARVKPAPAIWEGASLGSRRQGRAQGGREVGRSTARSSGPAAPHLYHLVRARRPASSEGSFRLVRPRSGRVGGVWAAFMCLHWRSVLSSGSLPAAPALEVGRQRNGRHFRVEWPPRGRIGRGRVRLAGPTRCWPTSHSAPPRSHSRVARSHWERRARPVGPRQLPLGGRVGLSKRDSKSEWEHQGRGSQRGGRRLGAARRPRRVPLAGASGGRATTVCAPLPLGDLPSDVS